MKYTVKRKDRPELFLIGITILGGKDPQQKSYWAPSKKQALTYENQLDAIQIMDILDNITDPAAKDLTYVEEVE